ncbi:Zinc finger CCCH domain-containing protein 42 [Zostera marina]|uniref:Zinc finger CCCH domain-containing protein 42 n=1 Tax=Zostera marina TaxID=29655 RepID=A0A0K9NZZ6_ZOSMR|nr:Zinc finger CCCH domain-containing protein 42 [Zostera marina]
MNPLTLVKRIQKINSTEASLGISEEASWHAKYKDSAYVYVGGISFDLTEGDLLAVFAQYGELVDVNLVRDKGTGKSKGFAFLAYEDQRSTVLAVDNLNGSKILGRIVRVDHVTKYKKKQEEELDEEEEKQKREARGVCHAFQKGECNRGDSCKFSHDEQRNANTGGRDGGTRWEHDRSDGPPLRETRGVCYAFQRGECNRGDSCKFSHDEQRNAAIRNGGKRSEYGRSDGGSPPSRSHKRTKDFPDAAALGRSSRDDDDGQSNHKRINNRSPPRSHKRSKDSPDAAALGRSSRDDDGQNNHKRINYRSYEDSCSEKNYSKRESNVSEHDRNKYHSRSKDETRIEDDQRRRKRRM